MSENSKSEIRNPKFFRRRLLAWYDQHQRDLPWRAVLPRVPNPYHVLVSEAMLQQTQVATVVAYFERFIAALPTVADLAAAEEQQVLRLWQGLGYYRRARHLHAAAKRIMADHGGQVPRNLADLLALPGVGRYSAGAIASIAYDEPAPILDGNVARVLARWFAIAEPIDEPAVRRQLWELAEQLVPAVPRDRPGDFNQALMELGAMVCVPRRPACLLCPVAQQCAARQAGLTETLPVRLPRKPPRAVVHAVAAIERNGQWLFQRRPSAGLWANLWQLPTFESAAAPPTGAAMTAWVREHLGLTVEPISELSAFTHQTTHRTIRFTGHRLHVRGGRLRPGRGTWRPLRRLDDLPLANPQRRMVAMLAAHPAAEPGR